MAHQAEDFDVIVIGGGPGGSTLATFVAMQGHRVLLLEKDQFPRYQIGESLLPSTLGICKALGVLKEVESAGFMPKNGGVWYWGSNDTPGWGFNFDELPEAPVYGKAWAYQVERMKFDNILLRNASKQGVDVRENHKVNSLIEEDGRVVGVQFTDEEGQTQIARARFVADAGGNASPYHKIAGQRIFADRFRNLALFCYYEGGKRLPPPQSGSILNVTFDKGWFWYIPLTDSLTSLGAVISTENAHLVSAGHEQCMNSFIDSCPLIKEYLGSAKRVTEGVYGQYRVRRDWSYCNTKFWKPGLVLIGDSACFIDPLFSSGLHLATYSALLAARSINTCLKSSNRALSENDLFHEYEIRYREEYNHFYQFLSRFYDRNKTKEDYFRNAHEILGTNETDRQAFVRLVSGFSRATPKNSAVAVPDGPKGDLDIFLLGKSNWTEGIPKDSMASLVPSSDGFHWSKASLRKTQQKPEKKLRRTKPRNEIAG